MRREAVEARPPRALTRRESYWIENFGPRQTPGSLELTREFVDSLHKGDLVLEVGCASGRVSIDLEKRRGVIVIGVDINRREINFAKEKLADYPSQATFEKMDGTQLEYLDNQFDSAVMVGVLGGVGKEEREKMVSEAFRVVKPGGSVAVAEFEFNPSNPEKISKYEEGERLTGEPGNKIIVRQEDGVLLFIAKHFTENELKKMLDDAGFILIKSKGDTNKAKGIGDGIVEERQQLTVWGVKPL